MPRPVQPLLFLFAVPARYGCEDSERPNSRQLRRRRTPYYIYSITSKVSPILVSFVLDSDGVSKVGREWFLPIGFQIGNGRARGLPSNFTVHWTMTRHIRTNGEYDDVVEEVGVEDDS